MTKNTDATEHQMADSHLIDETTEEQELGGNNTRFDGRGDKNTSATPEEQENGPDRSDSEDLSADDGEVEETFPREYVEKLRDENAKYRQRAQRADDLAHRLHTELVRATGRLADPTDLEFDEGHLEDPDALTAAVEDLLARKPHLASRTPRGDVGQGHTGTETVDLAGILRAAAG